MKGSATNAVAKIIRTKREALGYSQSDMGAKLGLTQNGYGKIELAQYDLTVDRLLAICEVLEIPLDVIFNRELRKSA